MLLLLRGEVDGLRVQHLDEILQALDLLRRVGYPAAQHGEHRVAAGQDVVSSIAGMMSLHVLTLCLNYTVSHREGGGVD